MSQLSITKLWYKLEDWRLAQHFKRVEVILQNRDVSHLSPTLQKAREHYLDQLHAYVVHGIFPRNYERLGYTPCFIDRDGRDCAVAYLVKVSGHNKLAQDIAVATNYAYIRQMNFPELDDWAAQSGLSKEELALIQPGYWLTFSYSLLTFAIATWATGTMLSIINVVQVMRQRNTIIMPVIGLVFGVLLLLLSVIYLGGSMLAFDLSNAVDVPQYWKQQAHNDAKGLLLAGQVSLCFATLTVVVGLYSVRKFIQARRKTIPQKPICDTID